MILKTEFPYYGKRLHDKDLQVWIAWYLYTPPPTPNVWSIYYLNSEKGLKRCIKFWTLPSVTINVRWMWDLGQVEIWDDPGLNCNTFTENVAFQISHFLPGSIENTFLSTFCLLVQHRYRVAVLKLLKIIQAFHWPVLLSFWRCKVT